MKVRNQVAVLEIVAGLLLSACVVSGPMKNASTDGLGAPLNHTGWLLANLNNRPVIPGTKPTLNLESGALSGSDGCNSYSGSYRAAGEAITVSKEFATTRRACDAPIMQQSADYFAVLTQANTYRIADGRLALLDAGGRTLAIFTQQSRALSGTAWTVTGYNNGRQAVVNVIAGTDLTADFNPDGKLSGSAGCNTYTATYETTANRIIVGPAAASRKTCPGPAGVMGQEIRFLAALQTAATYRIDGDRLELRTAEGALSVSLSRNPPKEAFGNRMPPGSNPENATYLIEGEAVTLVNGIAETALAPGSASRRVTRYFGNAVAVDLNSDGLADSVFLLVQDAGGSGTFYYVAAALNTPKGCLGTNAILLGDRIAPQRTMTDPDNPDQVIVSYADRAAGEPMASKPTQMVSRTFRLRQDRLVEVEKPSARTSPFQPESVEVGSINP